MERSGTGGPAHQREQGRQRDAQRKEDERRERAYQREVARLEKIKENELRQRQQQALRQQREAEQSRLQEDRYLAAQERQLANVRRAEYQSVVRRIRQAEGIRPERLPSGSSKKRPPGYEEWQDLPLAVKRRDRGQRYGLHNKPPGTTLDDMAATIAEEFPELRIECGDDLAAYLQREHRALRGLHFGRAA